MIKTLIGGVKMHMPQLTDDERQIVLDGCLINYYKE